MQQARAKVRLTGRSIFLLVDIAAADMFEAVAELFHHEHRGEFSAEREDVNEKAGRFPQYRRERILVCASWRKGFWKCDRACQPG